MSSGRGGGRGGGQGTSASEDLRFAVVGAGTIGRHHADVISAGAGMRLVALVDVDTAAAERLADHVATCGGARPLVLARLEDALAREDVDAVSVCVPSGLHADVAVAALGAGRHVVVEKPLDVSLAAARRVAAAAAGAPGGARAAVISQHRYDPGSLAVRRALDAGRLGRLTSAVASLAWYRGQGYYDSAAWRGTAALDGGALMNQGVHTLDLLLWFLGRPVQVQAAAATLAHERLEAEDTVVATVRFASGALAAVHATTAAYPGVTARLQVHGTAGSAVLDNDRLVYFHAAGAEGGAGGAAGAGNQAVAEVGRAESALRYGEGGELFTGQSRQYADVVASLAAGRQPRVGVDDALLVLATIRAVYASAATGRPVDVDDVLADAADAADGVVR